MPSRNVLKIYVKGGYYHIYNRGVDRQRIFKSKQDYKVFLSYLKYSLSPPPDPRKMLIDVILQGQTFKGLPRLPKSFHKKIELIAFTLMPNHFHLLIKQSKKDDIASFVSSLITRYAMYFNKKYDRVGPLFQGRYKAALVADDTYLVYLTCYLHTNASGLTTDLADWYSSYSDYLGITNTDWINKGLVLKMFDKR